MASLLDLANRLDAEVATIENKASSIASECALKIVDNLAHVTPVDTSKALSNWIVTLDEPAYFSILPYSVGFKGSTQSESASQTVEQAKKVLADKKPGQKIFITNNLRYIRVLNDGSSDQTSAGFVERAELIGRKFIANVKRLV